MKYKLFVPADESLELKDLGYNTPGFGEYRQWDGCELYLELYQDDNCESTNPFTTEALAPLWQEAFDFVEKKFHMKADVGHSDANGTYKFTIWKWNFDNTVGKWERIGNIASYETRFEANIACLRKLIELIKTNKNGNK